MRNTLRTLVLGGGLLASASLAHGQTTLLDTIGTGTAFNEGQSSSSGKIVGYDPGNANPGIPTAETSSGYAVLPFAFTGSGFNVGSVTAELQVNSPTQLSSSNQLFGAFIAAPSGTGGSLNGQSTVGGFFQFNLTTSTSPAGPAVNPSTGKGNNVVTQVTASNLNIALNPGQTYWLVLSPKAGFGAQPGDTLLDYGIFQAQTATAITNGGGSISNGTATVGAGLFETAGANSGDTLSQDTVIKLGHTTSLYFGARIVAAASVPETSTVVTAVLGLAPIGGLLIRRRRAKAN